MDNIKYLTRYEFEEILKAIKSSDSPYKIRDLTMIMLAEYCALRISEAIAMKKEYYVPKTHEIFCPRLKDSNSNNLKILDEDLIELLEYHIATSDPKQEYLFISQIGKPISREQALIIFKSYCRKAGIIEEKKINFHSLEHTRGQFLADSGFDIKEVQYWLGHKSIKNTYIYFQFSQTQKMAMYKKLEGFYNNKQGLLNDMVFEEK